MNGDYALDESLPDRMTKRQHQMRQLREEGLTLQAIGRAFGITKEGARRALAYEPHGTRLEPEERRRRNRIHAANCYRRKCGLPLKTT